MKNIVNLEFSKNISLRCKKVLQVPVVEKDSFSLCLVLLRITVFDSMHSKALHSELLTKLSGRFPSRNEYFVISEVRVERHFFVIFGKFGISKKIPNFENRTLPKLAKTKSSEISV
jgi:hypothetical protein